MESAKPSAAKMYDPAGRKASHPALLWPAVAAAAMSEMAALFARQWADLAVGHQQEPAGRAPEWTTPHRVALELKTAWLRDFTTARQGEPTLLCTPFALHGATVADLAPGHSLVAALRAAGLRRLFVVDWRSATPDMRLLGIDDYLADLNVMVDQVGAPVDLIGLCQGGWLALIYAARFPKKVRKLVLAGAPIDVRAAPSALSALAGGSPLAMFQELVRLGDGIVPGHKVLTLWGPATVEPGDVRGMLGTDAPEGSAALAQLTARFQEWYAWTVDLPGTYFLEVVNTFYKHNVLAAGHFVALGQKIDLATVTTPVFLLAARDDELVAPPQLFAVEKLVGTPAHEMHKATAPCRHVGLFMNKAVLEGVWPDIARWLAAPVRSVSARAVKGLG